MRDRYATTNAAEPNVMPAAVGEDIRAERRDSTLRAKHAGPRRSGAPLTQCRKWSQPWGWSDHGADLEVAKEALLYGPTYLERHFTIKGARSAEWDTYPAEFRELRKHAEAVAWEGQPEHVAACEKYLNRWQGEK